MMEFLGKIYKSLLSEEKVKSVERFFVISSIVAFLSHVLLIFLKKQGLIDLYFVNGSYIKTIFTPFALLLIFEVYLLIASVPKSIIRSIAKQYEVLSIIVLWRVFKEASKIDSLSNLSLNDGVILNLLADLGASLFIFLLIGIFYKTVQRPLKEERDEAYQTKGYKMFKKALALVLMLAFIGLCANGIYDISSRFIAAEPLKLLEVQEGIILNFFTAMIFTDTLIVLVYYMIMDEYHRFFRNAAFVISTIFIRLSISAPIYFSIVFAILAPIIGIIASKIYNYINYDCKDI